MQQLDIKLEAPFSPWKSREAWNYGEDVRRHQIEKKKQKLSVQVFRNKFCLSLKELDNVGDLNMKLVQLVLGKKLES